MMKLIYLSLFAACVFAISCNTTTETNNEPDLGDTIQTASGLQYFYIKKGDGLQVEKGCEVGTYLSLMVNDSVVWNSDEGPDSLFTFIAGFTRLITGFDEITMLLREGDEVVAILPDSIAYGAKGAGDVIPPHATLIYDKFKVVKVAAPKAILADTLYTSLKNEGFKEMLNRYYAINTSSDSVKYHLGKNQLYGLWYKLTNDSMHQEAINMAAYFAPATKDNWLRYYMVRSFENQNKIQIAIDSLKAILTDEPDNETMKDKMNELVEKLNAENQ